MKRTDFTLESVRRVSRDVYELILSGDTEDITAPGQFVNIALPGWFLRRPVSVCDWKAHWITLLVKEAGAGTHELVRMAPDTKLDLLTGLGNGFDLSVLAQAGNRADTETEGETSSPNGRTAVPDGCTGVVSGHTAVPDGSMSPDGSISPDRVILAGGGIGAAPLYGLAIALVNRGIVPTAALGFRSAEDAFYVGEFQALGCQVSIATEDGSLGRQGYVTDLLSDERLRDYVFCCGPSPMLRAVHALPHLAGGQFSFEARMACGFGACMGCSLPTAHGMRRVCKDGPVFTREEIVWQD